MSKGAEMIAAERERQVTEEGWTPEHDQGHAGELILAGQTYARSAHRVDRYGDMKEVGVPPEWPWAGRYYKPTNDAVKDLVKAGALLAAAIDALLAEADS